MRVEIKQNTIVRLAVGIAALLFSADAMAATQSITENIAFDTPLALVDNNDIGFGTVQAAVGSSTTYTIDTTGALTVTSGTGVWLYGTKQAANIKITGSATDTLSISVGGYSAASNGVTAANATCNYNSGGAGSCTIASAAAPGSSGKTLLIGADAIVDGTQAAGTTASPTFTLTVAYN